MADLSGADLSGADLRGANLSGTDLRGTNLTSVDLSGADVFSADLRGANLTRANLTRVNFTGANLWWADLLEANVAYCSLSGAILYGARCVRTSFSGVDLSQVVGLRRVEHFGPSRIDLDTLIESYRSADEGRLPALEAFFRGAGVPHELLAELPRIMASVKYRTCFIVFGEPDRAFAGKLKQDLEARGVGCWLYSGGAAQGDRTWTEIPNRGQDAERMVVLCSAWSLAQDVVLKEIEEQVREDQDKLIAVSLDDVWKGDAFRVVRSGRDLKPLLLERSCADFSDASRYEGALETLLEGLKPPRGQS